MKMKKSELLGDDQNNFVGKQKREERRGNEIKALRYRM
jgi:hypothetical protein